MRKRAQRIERAERIAASVFAEKGYEGANFELIAAELDLRGPSLYHYFASKEELFLRCIRRSAEEVFGRLQTIVDGNLDAVDKLRALFREQVLIEVRDYPEFVPLFFKTYVPVLELRDEILELRRTHGNIFERVADTVRDRSEIDQADIRVWLSVAFGALAYLPEWYDPHGSLGVESLADKLADTLVEPFLRHSPPGVGYSASAARK
jgi:AcrR family transcriptional regulator